MSLMLLGILNQQVSAGGAGPFYYYRGSGQQSGYVPQMQVDSSGGIYIILANQSSGSNEVIKYNPDLTQAWVRRIDDNQSTRYYVTSSMSPDDYLFVFDGNTIYKWATDGTLVWQKYTGASGYDGRSIYTNGTNVWFSARNVVGKVQASDGALVWQKTFSNANYIMPMAIDSSQNVYVSSTDYDLTSGIKLTKLDSSGNFVWQKTWSDDSGNLITGIGVDSSNDIYVSYGTYDNNGKIIKFDSSGTVLWVRSITTGGPPRYGNATRLVILSNDKIFVTLKNSISSTNLFRSWLVNPDGTYDWSATMTALSGGYVNVDKDANDNLFWSAGNDTSAIAFRLPSASNFSGSYTVNGLTTSLTYEAGGTLASSSQTIVSLTPTVSNNTTYGTSTQTVYTTSEFTHGILEILG